MITKAQYNNILSQHAEFIETCEAYKVLLQSNELPLSINVQELELELRVRQFTALMAVSESTKFKYSITKTDEAKKQLVIENTTLDGNTVWVDIQSTLLLLERLCRSFAETVSNPLILTVPVLLDKYELSPVAFMDSILIDWSKKHTNEYNAVKEYADAYNEFLRTMQGLQEVFDARTTDRLFKRSFDKNYLRVVSVEIDDNMLYQFFESVKRKKK